MSKARQLLVQLDRFVEKLSGVNKPYKALQKTDEWQAFHKQFEDAIKQQASWASEHIGEIGRHGYDKSYLERNMPSLNTLITQDDVVAYYKFCFEWAAVAQYQRMGVSKSSGSQLRKDVSGFKLTNPQYLARLQDNAKYLLNTKSKIDNTTADQIIKIIQDGRTRQADDGSDDPMTNDELANQIDDEFDGISIVRANMITRTESASAMGDADLATMVQNNVPHYDWIDAGLHPCVECEENADGSPYDIDSGPDLPAHVNCECYRQADTSSMDLAGISIWDGS